MCIFCEIAKGNIPSYKVYEDEECLAFLDISQATIGHTLVVPKKHFNDIFDLDKTTAEHLFDVARRIAIKIKDNLNVEGINILNNSGEVAGQSVKHFHIHVIPRRNNDNFNINFPNNKLNENEFIDIANKIKL